MTTLTPGAWLGIALFAGYAFWLFAFFTWVRPRVMRGVGRRLRTRVTESTEILDAGTWTTEEDAPLRKTGAVLGLDFVVIMLGTVGVAALVFIPAFIVAESGVLLPLESRMTGRAVALRLQAPTAMDAKVARSTLAIEVDNIGRSDLRACRAEVTGYNARDGYLHGASPFFDLRVGARAASVIRLDATRPPPGRHEIRIRLDCDNERLAVEKVTLDVR